MPLFREKMRVHKLIVGFLVAMWGVALWGPAMAQPKPRKAPKKEGAKAPDARTDEPDDAFSAMGVQIPAIARITNERRRLFEQMREWSRQMAGRQYGQASNTLKSLRDLKMDLGYDNIFGMSQLLLREGDKADDNGDSMKALELYREARLFSPDLAEPHFRFAWLTLRSDPAKIYRVVKSYLNGLKVISRDIFSISVLSVNALRFLGWLFGSVFVLFWVILLLRSLRLFQSDFRDLFPHGVTSFQIQLLSLFLLFLPLLMGAGLLETLLCWIFISWFYQTKGERILTTVGLLLLSAAPYAADWAGRFASLAESPLASIYLLNRSEMNDRAVHRVQALTRHRKWRKDPRVWWSLGLHYKRSGELARARSAYKKAIQYSKDPALLVNLANLDLISQRSRKAYEAYSKALRRRGVPEGQYNLSLIFQYSTSTDTSVVGQKVHALSAARRGGGERIEQFIRQTKKQLNRFAMDVQIPRSYYIKGLQKLPDNAVLKRQLWTYAATWIPVASAPWVGLGMALLLWILLPIVGRFFCGYPCEQCGDVIGRREQKGNNAETQCTQCLQMSGKREGISPERRVKKELEIQRHRRRRSYMLVGFAAICPGAGQILLRESAKGFWVLSFVSIALFMWLFQLPLLVHPLAMGAPVSLVWQIAWAAFAGLLYLRALRESYEER